MKGSSTQQISREALIIKAQPYKDLKNATNVLRIQINHLRNYVANKELIPFARSTFQEAYRYAYLESIQPFYRAGCFESKDCSPINEAIIKIEKELEKIEEPIRNLNNIDEIGRSNIKKSLDICMQNLALLQKRVSPYLRQIGI
ncbi:MAG: hypothetical protein ACFFCW_43935 [Candidatus Hodarchaeota archaeon]